MRQCIVPIVPAINNYTIKYHFNRSRHNKNNNQNTNCTADMKNDAKYLSYNNKFAINILSDQNRRRRSDLKYLQPTDKAIDVKPFPNRYLFRAY